jgi:hypothetical protein
VTASTADERLVGDSVHPWRAVRLDLGVDPAGQILELTTDAVDVDISYLIGRPAGRGLRRALDERDWSTPAARAVRRMLWDVPIVTSLRHQTRLLDHPLAPGGGLLNSAGTDQCSGWRAGGEMLVFAEQNDGRLTMPLTAAVTSADRADEWVSGLPDLPPMATRRIRSTIVGPVAAGRVSVRVAHRDSYTDPDLIERRLHEWTVTTEFDLATRRFADVATAPGRLPWFECPAAARSSRELDGVAASAVEARVSADFRGITTCTHLNDTLRLLADVEDLLVTSD